MPRSTATSSLRTALLVLLAVFSISTLGLARASGGLRRLGSDAENDKGGDTKGGDTKGGDGKDGGGGDGSGSGRGGDTKPPNPFQYKPLNPRCHRNVSRTLYCIEGPAGMGCHRNVTNPDQASSAWIQGVSDDMACDPSDVAIFFDGRGTASYSLKFRGKPVGSTQFESLFSMYANFRFIREYVPAYPGAPYNGSFVHGDGSIGPFDGTQCKQMPAFPSEPFGFTCSNVVGYQNCSAFTRACTVCRTVVRRLSVLQLAGETNSQIEAALGPVCDVTYAHPESGMRPADCRAELPALVPALTSWLGAQNRSSWLCEADRCCNRTYAGRWQLESPSGAGDFGTVIGVPQFGDGTSSSMAPLQGRLSSAGYHLDVQDKRQRFGMRTIVPSRVERVDNFTVHPNAFKVTFWFDAARLSSRTDTGFALFVALDAAVMPAALVERVLNGTVVGLSSLVAGGDGGSGGFAWDTRMSVAGGGGAFFDVLPTAHAEVPLAAGPGTRKTIYAVFSVPPRSGVGGRNMGQVVWDPVVAMAPDDSERFAQDMPGGNPGPGDNAAARTRGAGGAVGLRVAVAALLAMLVTIAASGSSESVWRL